MLEVKITLLSIFANFCTTFLLALLLITSGRRYKNFIMFNVIVAFWSLFYGLYIVAQSKSDSILYARISMFFMVLIPYMFFRTAIEISGFRVKKLHSIINNSTALAISLSMLSPYMIVDMRPFLGLEFVPKISWPFHSFHVYYAILVTYGLLLVHRSIKNNYKNKLIFYSLVTGFLGGTTNIFPYLSIPIYPFFNFLIAVYCLIATYALMKHRMLDGMSAMREGIVKVISFLLLLLIYIVLLVVYNYLIIDASLFPMWLFNGLYLLASLEMHQILNKFLHITSDKLLGFGVKYKKNSLQKEINNKILDVVNIKVLSDNFKHLIEKGMGVKIQSFYVAEGVMSGNEIDNSKDFSKSFGVDIPKNELTKIQDAMRNNGLTLSVKRNEANSELGSTMVAINCHGLVPLIFNNKVMGFLSLESRPGKSDYFYYEDMELFDDLADKSGMALERVRLHMDIVNQKEKTLKSLAGSIAHEVRNPLSALSMISGQIREYADNLSQKSLSREEFSTHKEELVELTEMALKSVKRTNEVIDITLSDLRGGEVDKSKFVLLESNQVINNALNEYGYRNKEEKQRVIFKENKNSNFVFNGDETMLIYIVFNLVKNALYYLKECPDLTITISSKFDENNNIIEIKDTGPGIPSDKLESIFESFATSGKEGGTGLGLPFCKRVMKSFDGSIKCESKPGEYTKFILNFPKINEENEGRKIQNKIKAKSILLFDDQEVNLKACQRVVNKMTWDIGIDIVIDGKQALEAAKVRSYDLIILDSQMPTINGPEATEEIRKVDKNVPIAFYTTERFIQTTQEDLKCKVDDYIIKSDPNKDLINLFNKWILVEKNQEIKNSLENSQIEKALKDQEILVVDDEGLNLRMLSNLLEKNGLKVQKFDNAKNLLEKYKEQFENKQENQEKVNKYTIITDINMPGMNGNELATEIRKFGLLNNITNPPVIIGYSGDGDKDKIHQFRKDGIDDFFIKGEDTNGLLKILAFWTRDK